MTPTRVVCRPIAETSPRPDAGFSIVLAVSTILILMVLGMAMVTLVVEDSNIGTNQVQSNQALYAAHAGIEYAVVKIAANSAWTGLPSPGKTVGGGSFWISPPDAVDENGAPLAAGQKRIIANGIVGGATRQIQVHVAPGMITAYAGTGTSGSSGDGGAATAARLASQEGVSVAANGDLYIADLGNDEIRKVNVLTGIITTVAGTGSNGYTGDGGPATAAKLKNPKDVAVAGNGDLYIADTANHVIRKVTAATGIITTVAGSGSTGSTGDGGAATAAKLRSPAGIAVAANGDLYIGDTGNDRVRKVTAATGIITAFAGTGTAGYLGDGAAATAARLKAPQGLIVAASGDVYIADTGNHAIRKVSVATGFITTYAGTGTAGFLGDGGAATSARLSSPQAVSLNAAGDLYIADTGNNRIRRVAVSGTITTIAGTGAAGNTGDGGSAASALLNSPRGVTVSATGVYYIGDQGNNRVRKVTGLIAVVAWVETRS